MSKAVSGLARRLWCVLAVLAVGVDAQTPNQAERGRRVFLQENCNGCHRFENQGTTVGPDLNLIAHLSPKAIAIAILATRTAHVISMKLKTGEIFPTMQTTEDQKTLRIYDLSKDPPVLRTVERSEVDSTKDNDSWKHRSAATTLTTEQLADLIAYLRWIAVRDRKGVAPADLQ